MAVTGFVFPSDTQAFLADLRSHNTKAWFDANRDRYQSSYVEPAKAFVETIGPALDELVPGIVAEPRINGSIFRINRDLRFSKDKTPYKDHLDFWFWEGERRTAVSGLFLRIAREHVIVGAGSHGFDARRLAAYRDAVADPALGDDLLATVAALEQAGHTIDGETLTRLPRGFAADGERARLLCHKALNISTGLPAEVATDPALVPNLLHHWRRFAPLHTWLVSRVR